MAMLFDVAILVVLFSAVSLLLPGLVKSDFDDVNRPSATNDLHDSQVNINDANSAIKSAKTASDSKAATSDLKNAQHDYANTAKDARKNGVSAAVIAGHSAKSCQTCRQ